MKKTLSIPGIVLSLVGSILLWAIVTDAWGYSARFFPFYGGSTLYAVLSRLIWVLPALLLIARKDDFLHFKKAELFSCPRLDRPLLLFFLVSSAYILTAMLVGHKGWWYNTEVNPMLEAIKYISVGCVEEIVFRGWGYNALLTITSDKKARAISTVLFILLHWPAYFVRLFRFGAFDAVTFVTQSLSVFLCGLAFCWLLKKGKTLWNPIIAHSIYDLISTLLVG